MISESCLTFIQYLTETNEDLLILSSFFFFFGRGVAALVPLIFKNMAMVIMDHHIMQVARRGALRGKLRSHS